MYAASLHCVLFASATRYAALRAGVPDVVREGTSPDYGFPWSERHLRCVWVDPAYRPAPLTTEDGQHVTVESPGRWNLEAGPDFLDAVLKIAPDERRLCGDVELHIRPSDWRRHNHARDPRYRHVIAHVTYFPGAIPPDELPPGSVQLSLCGALRSRPSFSFESLDLLAYPYAQAEASPPCASILRNWTPEAKSAFLEAAGAERLRRKTARLATAVRDRGAGQVLYEETLCALGYKNNRRPFRELACRVPVATLQREAAQGGIGAAYALLCGVAGLLPVKHQPHWDDETRRFVRGLWDVWWKRQSEWREMVMARDQWILCNLRPQNHPLRRLMAAAELFAVSEPLDHRLAKIPLITGACGDILAVLENCGMESYWARRHSLSSPPLPKPLALLGPGRAAAVATNVVIPWLVGLRDAACPDAGLLNDLPAEDDNRCVRHTAHALFGHDHNPRLYRTGLRQQGLLQVFQDFCLNSRGGCRTCTLPQALDHQK